MISKTLFNGIIISDSREIGCGVQIQNQKYHSIELAYSSQIGLYLNLSSTFLSNKEIDEHIGKLKEMQQVLNEANNFLNQTR